MSGSPNQPLTSPLVEPRNVPIKTLRVSILPGSPDEITPPAREGDVLTVGTAPGNDVVVQDRTVSGYHLELIAKDSGILVIDLGSTNGTYAHQVSISKAIVRPETILKIGRSQLRVSQGAQGQAVLTELTGNFGLIGASQSMERLYAQVEKVAGAPVGTHLHGETGTGKELVARALHQLSDRKDQPFVTVDCGSVSPNLIASELFGHEKGSFTGATGQRIGAFERADGGFLFLDEVGELPPSLQPQLLGVLERGRFLRVGGTKEVSVDVRIVSATHRDLRREVNDGSFRLDLYYRLAQVVLELPPLRDRSEDIPVLLQHFLRECGHAGPIAEVISEQTLQELQAHRWPGNVRELRNWVEATIALGEIRDIPGPDTMRAMDPHSDEILMAPYKEARAHVLRDFEERYLARLLRENEGNVSAAAREARMDRTYLIKLLARHQLR